MQKIPETYLEALGLAIQQAREAAGMTQQEAALSIGYGQPSISTWENGKRAPTIAVLRSMALTYKTKVSVIIGESEIIWSSRLK